MPLCHFWILKDLPSWRSVQVIRLLCFKHFQTYFLFWLFSFLFWQLRWFFSQVHFVFPNCARLIQTVCFGKKELWPILRHDTWKMFVIVLVPAPNIRKSNLAFYRHRWPPLPGTFQKGTRDSFFVLLHKLSLASNKNATSYFTWESHVFQDFSSLVKGL